MREIRSLNYSQQQTLTWEKYFYRIVSGNFFDHYTTHEEIDKVTFKISEMLFFCF